VVDKFHCGFYYAVIKTGKALVVIRAPQNKEINMLDIHIVLPA